MSDEWPWAETEPVFSARGRREMQVPRVPHGVVPATLGPAYVGTVVGFAIAVGVVGIGVGMLAGAVICDAEAAGWWWLALILPAGFVALFFFSGIYVDGTEATMVPAAVALTAGTGAAAGLGLASALLALIGRHHAVLLTPELLRVTAAALAGGAVLLGVCARVAVRRARRDVQRILDLRAHTAPVAGMILALPDPKTWNGGGDIPVRYDPGSGERVITVRMTTDAHEIPVRGSLVHVFDDGSGDVHVELDPQHPPIYEQNSRPYERDDSGGGS